MSYRLPILATVLAAYRDVFGDIRSYARIVWVIAALMFLVVEVPVLLTGNYVGQNVLPGIKQEISDLREKRRPEAPPSTASESPAPGTTDAEIRAEVLSAHPELFWTFLGIMALRLIETVLVFRFIYAWYRQLLTGENKGRTIMPRFGKPEWKIFTTTIKMFFVLLPFFFLILGVVVGAYPSGLPQPGVEAKPEYDPWPYVAVLAVFVFYMQSRLSLSYSAVAIDETEAPVRQSWNLTKKVWWRIFLGDLAVLAPIAAGVQLLSYGMSLAFGSFMPPTEDGAYPVWEIPVFIGLITAALSVVAMLLLVSVVSAFHAHVYAYLVRSSSSASIH